MKLGKMMDLRSFVTTLLSLLAITSLACTRTEQTSETLPKLLDDPFYEVEIHDTTGNFVGKYTGTNWKIRNVMAKKVENSSGVVFVDENSGWLIASTKLLKTDNGGITWKTIQPELPDGALIANVQFTDSNHGWLMAQRYPKSFYDPDFKAENVQFWILFTNDGGENWRVQTTEKAVDISAVKFASPGVGAVIGRKFSNAELPFQTEYFLTLTTNGGESWTNMSQTLNESKVIEDVESPMKYPNDRPEVLIISGPDQIKFITHSRRVLETTDGGKTWRKKSQYAHDDPQVGIKNFGYKDDGTEWMFESTYSIEGIRARLKTRSIDNSLMRNVIGGVYFSNAYYLGRNAYIASGQTGDFGKTDQAIIWFTEDDGKTWSEIYRNPKSKEVVSMSSVDRNTFWALCDDGTIIHLTRSDSQENLKSFLLEMTVVRENFLDAEFAAGVH